MNDTNLSSFAVDLDRSAHEQAAKFAAGQTSIAKGKKVYLNTLAVCAVRQYLSCVCQLDLDLSHGDSWQIELQSILDVADLVIPNFGKIECLPVLPNVTEISLPLAAIDERIGYVLVQFSEQLDRVELLGFVAQPAGEIISLGQLQPLENLLDLIYVQRLNNLSEFLTGMLGIGWESIENLIEIDANTVESREFALRNTIVSVPSNASYESIRDFTAGKMINLRATLASIPLLLLIGLNQEADGRIRVKIRLHSGGGVPVLPANIKLSLQTADDEVLSQIEYRRAMNFIQLQSFKLQPGTEFKVQIVLDSDVFTESFIA